MSKQTFIQFLLSKEFRKQLKIVLAVFFAIILFTNLLLRILTKHNRTFPVPDFRGMQIPQVIETAAENNLQWVIADSVFNQRLEPGAIVDQEPKQGQHVKKGRRVFFIINAFNPEKVKMPTITGVSLRQALTILETNGLQTGTLKYVPDIATNNVLQQKYNGKNIKAGSVVIKGSKIDLILGQAGDGNTPKVPDISELDLFDARLALANQSLNTGKITYSNNITTKADTIAAKVKKQVPLPNTWLYMGGEVDIFLDIENKEIEKNTND